MIKLKDFGKFFSGRTHAVEILEKSKPFAVGERFVFDFENVESFSQSFVSELIVKVKSEGIDLNSIDAQNFSNDSLKSRFFIELDRIKNL